MTQGARLKFSKSRAAADPQVEAELLRSLRDAFVLLEICNDLEDTTDMRLCESNTARKIKMILRNIGEDFVSNALRDVTPEFLIKINSIFR